MEKLTNKIKIGNTSAYNINYHLVWCPKRRKSVLVGEIASDAKIIFNEVAK